MWEEISKLVEMHMCVINDSSNKSTSFYSNATNSNIIKIRYDTMEEFNVKYHDTRLK